MLQFHSPQLPANRWSGSNRGGWTNPEFDRLAQQFNTTLDRSQRAPLIVQMAKIFSDEAAVISLYFNPTATAFVAGIERTAALPSRTERWPGTFDEWKWTS